jgi:hypothetical protein
MAGSKPGAEVDTSGPSARKKSDDDNDDDDKKKSSSSSDKKKEDDDDDDQKKSSSSSDKKKDHEEDSPKPVAERPAVGLPNGVQPETSGPRSRRYFLDTIQNLVSKTVGVAILLGIVVIIVAIFGGLRFIKRKPGPNAEITQADRPLLETEEFY